MTRFEFPESLYFHSRRPLSQRSAMSLLLLLPVAPTVHWRNYPHISTNRLVPSPQTGRADPSLRLNYRVGDKSSEEDEGC